MAKKKQKKSKTIIGKKKGKSWKNNISRGTKKLDDTRNQTNMKKKIPKWQNKNLRRFRPFSFSFILILWCEMLFVRQIKQCYVVCFVEVYTYVITNYAHFWTRVARWATEGGTKWLIVNSPYRQRNSAHQTDIASAIPALHCVHCS